MYLVFSFKHPGDYMCLKSNVHLYQPFLSMTQSMIYIYSVFSLLVVCRKLMLRQEGVYTVIDGIHFFKENDHLLKFENCMLKIYIRIIKHYTDINQTVTTRPCIFCISNRSRKQGKINVSKERLKILDRYSAAVVL